MSDVNASKEIAVANWVFCPAEGLSMWVTLLAWMAKHFSYYDVGMKSVELRDYFHCCYVVFLMKCSAEENPLLKTFIASRFGIAWTPYHSSEHISSQ